MQVCGTPRGAHPPADPSVALCGFCCHPRQFPSEFAWPRAAFSSWVGIPASGTPMPASTCAISGTSPHPHQRATALPFRGLNLSLGRALLQDCPLSVSGVRHLRHRSNSSLYMLFRYSSEFSFPLSSKSLICQYFFMLISPC